MRKLSPSFQAHLNTGVTTLCRCWRLTRTDGVVTGFTDHDRPLTFDGTDFSAAAGLAATGDVAKAGLGIGGFEIAGALSSTSLSDEDLADGAYDFATISMWVVNWQDTTQRELVREGMLGEITLQDGAFRAEVRGAMQALETVRGRVITHTCDADLGDRRCRVDLGSLKRTVNVVTVDGARLIVRDLAEAAGWCSDGFGRVLSGKASGRTLPIAVHTAFNDDAALTLRTAPLGLQNQDIVELSPGCDKRFATCHAKFSNSTNFQGFPHLPGNDRAFSYPRPSK